MNELRLEYTVDDGVTRVMYHGTELYWSTSRDAAQAYIAGYSRGWNDREEEGS